MKRPGFRSRVTRLKAPTARRGEPGAILTSDERRKRVAALILNAKLGRAATLDELADFGHAGGIVASIDADFCDRRVEEAERKGDRPGVERWRGIAAGLERLRAARERAAQS